VRLIVELNVGLRVGLKVGKSVELIVGLKVGECVGLKVGLSAGIRVGSRVGENVGRRVGFIVGLKVCSCVGSYVGSFVGSYVGSFVGSSVGSFVGSCVVGSYVGSLVGSFVRSHVGSYVVGKNVGENVGLNVGSDDGKSVGFTVPKLFNVSVAVPHPPQRSHASYTQVSSTSNPAKGGVYRIRFLWPAMAQSPPLSEPTSSRISAMASSLGSLGGWPPKVSLALGCWMSLRRISFPSTAILFACFADCFSFLGSFLFSLWNDEATISRRLPRLSSGPGSSVKMPVIFRGPHPVTGASFSNTSTKVMPRGIGIIVNNAWGLIRRVIRCLICWLIRW